MQEEPPLLGKDVPGGGEEKSKSPEDGRARQIWGNGKEVSAGVGLER